MRLLATGLSGLAFLVFFGLPRYLGAVTFFVILWLVLGDAVGGSLGLSNIFRDSAGVHEAFGWAWATSPTLWTGAGITLCSAVVMMFPCMEGLVWQPDPASLSDAEKAQRRRLQQRFFLGWAVAAALLFWVWWPADGSAPVAGERTRAAIGAVLGAVIFGLGFAIARGLLMLFHAYCNQLAGQLTNVHLALQRSPARAGWMRNLVSYSVTQTATNLRVVLKYRENLQSALFILPVLLSVLVAFVWPGTLIPAVALVALLLAVYLGLRLLWVFPVHWRVGVFLATALLLALPYMAGGKFFKNSFDGIVTAEGRDYYDADVPVLDIYGDNGVTPGRCGTQPRLYVDFAESLENWARLQSNRQIGRGTKSEGDAVKPKLVVVATSGGAYRAAYWTAMVLDRLIAANASPELFGIADSVRFITGASGGMVGAGYFAAGAGRGPWISARPPLVGWMEKDSLRAQSKSEPRDPAMAGYYYGRAHPIPRDSLSAVAQHLLQSDLPGLLVPDAAVIDRGKVLERQWVRLNRPFSDLATGEKEGWRPTMILSPMMVESGQPLLISNTGLDFLPAVQANEMQQFFDWFPCAHDHFTLATAVRMNATFPYISPAVSLPTNPRRRIVDAGYYDNYGVSFVNALLSNNPANCADQVKLGQFRSLAPTAGPGGIVGEEVFCFREWVKERTSGILLIEIRAFPLATKGETGAHCPRPARAGGAGRWYEFLTSPIEAILSARGQTQVFRNDQGFRRLRALARDLRIERVIFVNCAHGDEVLGDLDEAERARVARLNSGTLNWVVPADEFTRMQRGLESQWQQNCLALVRHWGLKPDAEKCPVLPIETAKGSDGGG